MILHLNVFYVFFPFIILCTPLNLLFDNFKQKERKKNATNHLISSQHLLAIFYCISEIQHFFFFKVHVLDQKAPTPLPSWREERK